MEPRFTEGEMQTFLIKRGFNIEMVKVSSDFDLPYKVLTAYKGERPGTLDSIPTLHRMDIVFHEQLKQSLLNL